MAEEKFYIVVVYKESMDRRELEVAKALLGGNRVYLFPLTPVEYKNFWEWYNKEVKLKRSERQQTTDNEAVQHEG